jgi:hypothetical protein
MRTATHMYLVLAMERREKAETAGTRKRQAKNNAQAICATLVLNMRSKNASSSPGFRNGDRACPGLKNKSIAATISAVPERKGINNLLV